MAATASGAAFRAPLAARSCASRPTGGRLAGSSTSARSGPARASASLRAPRARVSPLAPASSRRASSPLVARAADGEEPPSAAPTSGVSTRTTEKPPPASEDADPTSDAENAAEAETVAGTVRRKREEAAKLAAAAGKDAAPGSPGLTDTINPVEIGRKSRKFLDGVFKGIAQLTQVTSALPSADERTYDAVYDADLLSGETLTEFETPNARFTTVLVVGAAGRVGRVLVRKLLLRGYTVKALVRDASAAESIPPAVDVMLGDVSDAKVMEAAMQGVNKVVYCARAKTLVSGELNNVDVEGVKTATKALQDYNNALAIRRAGRSSKTKTMLTNFVKHGGVFEDWTVDETRLVDPSDGKWQAAAEVAQRVNFGPGFDSEGEPSKFPSFDGFVFSKTGVAQISADLGDLGTGDQRGQVQLREHDGVLLRLRGDGKRYSVSLREPGQSGRTFLAPFVTTGKWQIVRIPFSQFRPEEFNRVLNAGQVVDQAIDLNDVERVGIRFEARNQATSRSSGSWMDELGSRSENSFGLELEYVKLLPKGEETDFILVSCGGAGMEEGEDKEKLVAAKRQGERVVRNSGLGYTVIRPGTLLEEPGGNSALVFDQGNRIQMPISCADVADVCVKALHDEEARNKSFDVCYEYKGADGGEDGGATYEKIAQVTGKSNNYLTPALAVLEKNT